MRMTCFGAASSPLEDGATSAVVQRKLRHSDAQIIGRKWEKTEKLPSFATSVTLLDCTKIVQIAPCPLTVSSSVRASRLRKVKDQLEKKEKLKR